MDTASPINIATDDRQLSIIDNDINDIEIDDDEEMWGLEFDVDLPSLINDLERNANNGDNQQKEPQQHPPSEDVNDDVQPEGNKRLINIPLNKEQMESTFKQFNGFMTAGSKKSFDINTEMQQKALALFNSDYDASVSSAADISSKNKQTKLSNADSNNTSSSPSSLSLLNGVSDSANDVNVNQPKIQDPKIFAGFMTASGRNVPHSSDEALSKAKKLLLASQSSESQNDEPTEKSLQQLQSLQQIQQNAKNIESDVSLSLNTFSGGGFMTASGRSVPTTSKDALRKAQKLLLASQSSHIEESEIPKKEEKVKEAEQQSISVLDPVCGDKRPTDDNHYENNQDVVNYDGGGEQLQFKYEDLMSSHGGFMKANSKTLISVSTAAKQRAVALFNSSETTRELTQASQSPSSQRQSQSCSPLREDSFLQSPLQQITDSSPSPLRENSFQQSQQSPLRRINSHQSENIPSSSLLSPPPGSASPSKPVAKSPERLPPLPPHPRKRLKRQPQATMLKMKPFKSPVIQSNIELTKAAASGKSSSASARCKGKTVFSMNGT